MGGSGPVSRGGRVGVKVGVVQSKNGKSKDQTRQDMSY